MDKVDVDLINRRKEIIMSQCNFCRVEVDEKDLIDCGLHCSGDGIHETEGVGRRKVCKICLEEYPASFFEFTCACGARVAEDSLCAHLYPDE